jgi:hypothetical protein
MLSQPPLRCWELVGARETEMSRTSKIDHRETELTSGRNSSKRKGKVQEQEGENEEDELNLNETDTLLPSKSLLLLPEEKKLLTSSLVDDIYAVFYDVKFFAPLSALLFGVLGILIVLDPFTSSPQRPNPMSQTEYVSYLFSRLYLTYHLLL